VRLCSFLLPRSLLTETRAPSVSILPYGRSPNELLEPWEYWIGKIRDVRAEIHNNGTEEHNTVSVDYEAGGASVVIELFRCMLKSSGFILGRMWGTS
jgi:hypothetical protein